MRTIVLTTLLLYRFFDDFMHDYTL